MLSERQCVTRSPNNSRPVYSTAWSFVRAVPAPGAVDVPDDDCTRGGVLSAKEDLEHEQQDKQAHSTSRLALEDEPYFLLMSVAAILIQLSRTNMRRCPSCPSILPTRVYMRPVLISPLSSRRTGTSSGAHQIKTCASDA
jgi:hypothetical protein